MANALSAGRMLRRTTGVRPHCVLLACVFAVCLVVALRLTSNAGGLALSLGDTDDATRLVELHAFLEHGRWWDLTLPRIGAPDPLVSHWSRLVDLGLALTLGAARLVLSPGTAELAMRIVWPSLLLLATVLLVARDAERDGAVWSAIAVAGLVVMSPTALQQFNVGRIDHHNVQILCGVGGILLLARSLLTPAVGWWAGAMIGFGLTVGLESATLVGPVVVVAVLIGLGRRGGLDGQLRAAVTMAAVLAIGAVLSIDPSRWNVMVCDAVAFNLVALTACGAAGVAAAGFAARFVEGPRLVALQLGLLGIGGIAGLVIYGLLEPRCLAGPFGQVTPEVWPIWLSRVTEVQPIGYLYRLSPGGTIGIVLMAVLGIAARIRIALVERRTRDEAGVFNRHMLLLTAQVFAFVAACWQVKMLPYAAWLALPALGLVLASLPGTPTIGAPVVRLAAFVLVLQSTLGAIAGSAYVIVQANEPAKPPARTPCSDTTTISTLASLPPGLVLADVDLGPYIVALTPHRVVMAPYHRIDRSIVEGYHLLGGAPEAAEAALRRLAVAYVLACRPNEKPSVPDAAAKAAQPPIKSPASTLRHALATGHPPGYLAPVPLPKASELRVYRVVPSKS
ncbi:MAG: hypothetical protein AB7L90_13065 [Hyphomicrobiaceae bacterium]